ncbi:MAG: Hsp20/alpha crystallin family protein [Spirochaetia bacterium]
MKYMVRYNPTKNYGNALYDFDTMLNNLFGPASSHNRRSPLVDISENENHYVIEAEVPGYSQEEIDVQIEDNVLTISAGASKEQAEAQNEDKEYLVRERRNTEFSRSFSLPKDVDVEKIEGSYRNGILRLELAKKAEAKPRSIKVKAA